MTTRQPQSPVGQKPSPPPAPPPKWAGPEADFFHKLKGQPVKVVTHDDALMRGKLLWVDRYSIGLRLNPTVRDEERDLLVYKSGIATIERDEYDKVHGDETTNEPRPSVPTIG